MKELPYFWRNILDIFPIKRSGKPYSANDLKELFEEGIKESGTNALIVLQRKTIGSDIRVSGDRSNLYLIILLTNNNILENTEKLHPSSVITK